MSPRLPIIFDENSCLDANPFEGDFGMPTDRTLRRQIVTARKDHAECSCCLGKIRKGERCRVQIELFNGEMQDYRWCQYCCRAMAKSWHDQGRDWTYRERLRMLRAARMAPR